MAKTPKTGPNNAQAKAAQPMPAALKPAAAIQAKEEGKSPNRTTWLSLTAAAMLIYVFWSSKSDGFYQHDEAGHFLGMLSFWQDPGSILGNWAKFGYKLLYVIPAKLGGAGLVIVMNCLLAAGSALFIGLALQAQKSKYAIAGFLLVALQPLWLNLSFRNYSEIPTAFLLALAYYLHIRKKPLLAMLCVSYICTIRQEFYLVLGVYGLVLLFQKKWAAAFSGALFPIIQNFYGAYYTQNDYLYLYHQIAGQSQDLAKTYTRQGGEHYFLTAMVIFGPIPVVLAVQYVLWGVWNKLKIDWYLAVPVFIYYAFQVMINLQSIEIGPATGGNLRYMLVISPMVGGMAALGLEQFATAEKKTRALAYLLPLLLVTFIYLNHKTDLLRLTEETDATPALGVIMALAVLFWTGKPAIKTPVLGAFMALLVLLNVKALHRTPEENACKQTAEWFKRSQQDYAGKRIYVDHVMFYYYSGKTRYDFDPVPFTASTMENLKQAHKGDLFFWDSHYGARPGRVSQEYLLNHPDEWQLIQQNIATDQRFGILVFQKIK